MNTTFRGALGGVSLLLMLSVIAPLPLLLICAHSKQLPDCIVTVGIERTKIFGGFVGC